jgi:hypothetical protein
MRSKRLPSVVRRRGAREEVNAPDVPSFGVVGELGETSVGEDDAPTDVQFAQLIETRSGAYPVPLERPASRS